MLPLRKALLVIALLSALPLPASARKPAIAFQNGDTIKNNANLATMTKITTQAGTPVYLIGGAVKPPKIVFAPAP
jgi:hypothetical protein